jgi:potassium efflux system protein
MDRIDIHVEVPRVPFEKLSSQWVIYSANPLEVEQALLEAAQHPDVLDTPVPSVQSLDFGESSLDFAPLVWTDEPMSIPRLTSDLRYSIWDTFARRNIEIPFPQRDVHLRSGVALLQPAPPNGS